MVNFPLMLAAAVLVLGAGAECLHLRRVRSVAQLAFGPRGRAGIPALLAPFLRIGALAAMAWGLAILFTIQPAAHRTELKEVPPADRQHLLLLLDVSPSMRIIDAGPTGKQSRMQRARNVLDSMLARMGHQRLFSTVVAVYNGAKPVVEETRDLEVLHNLMNDLPMHHAFPSGKTQLLDGIAEAAKIAKKWPAGTATLVLISDGDTVPGTGIGTLPPSISGVLVVGVGDSGKGVFINGHNSRQDAATLRQIATRLGGVYHDANSKLVPTATLRRLGSLDAVSSDRRPDLRELAILVTCLSGVLLAGLPLLLHFAGSSWNPGPKAAPRNHFFSSAAKSFKPSH